jgi:hypothetical protein
MSHTRITIRTIIGCVQWIQNLAKASIMLLTRQSPTTSSIRSDIQKPKLVLLLTARRSSSPEWQHTFVFRLSAGGGVSELGGRALELTVWNNDTLPGKSSFLGGVRLGTGLGKCAAASVLIESMQWSIPHVTLFYLLHIMNIHAKPNDGAPLVELYVDLLCQS